MKFAHKIRPCNPYGPEVGKWKSHGTVAQTIARVRKELKERQENVTELRRKHG